MYNSVFFFLVYSQNFASITTICLNISLTHKRHSPTPRPNQPLSYVVSTDGPILGFSYAWNGTLVYLYLLSCVRLFATPWTAAHQGFLSLTISQSMLKFMSSIVCGFLHLAFLLAHFSEVYPCGTCWYCVPLDSQIIFPCVDIPRLIYPSFCDAYRFLANSWV